MVSRRAGELVDLGLTRKVLRGPRVERRSHGLYRPAGLDIEPSLARAGDALGLLVPGTVLGGWASLLLQGNRWFDGWGHDGVRRALVHCPPGTQLRRRDVVEPYRGVLRPDEWNWIDAPSRARVTTMARAAVDEARLAPDVRSAVVAVDMAVSRVHGEAHTTIEAVHRVESALWKVRGIVQARRALALATDRSASPLETRTRLCAVLDAGLTGLRVNAPVFDEHGDLLGVADLVDPETGLVVETDGSGHRDEYQHTLDNRREEAFEQAGCVVVRATGLDLVDLGALAARLVRGQRAARRATRRRWTVEPPPWWDTWSGARRWR
jgi:hypothetical protein